MTDRDTFAAAALAGLLAQGDDADFPENTYWAAAYRMADAMLRERGTAVSDNCVTGNQREMECPVTEPLPKTKRAEVSFTTHDAAPAATADSADDRTDKAAPSQRRDCTGDISEAQIDALECVVEDGRFVGMSVYGHLRSLLVRLRPEWEGESDRSKPISDERLAALDELSALDQKLELEYGLTGNPLIKARPRKDVKTDTTQPRNGALSDGPDPDSRVWETPCTPPPHTTPPHGSVHGGGSFPDSRNANEPVAWAVAIGGGNTLEATFCGPEAREEAIEWCHPTSADRPVPLYRHPQPTLTDEEREAIHQAAIRVEALCQIGSQQSAATLRKLLERLA